MREHGHHGWRRAALWSIGAVLAVLAVLVIAWDSGALNTPALWLVGEASGYRLSCKTLDGGLLSQLTCTDLKLEDSQGELLSAKRLALNWNAIALLANRVEIASLRLSDARLTRLPQSKSSATTGFLPRTDIKIARLEVAHLVLALPNRPHACIGLGGRAAIGPGGLAGDLDLTRCDGPRGQMAFHGRYVKATGAVTLHAHGSDDGALLTQLTGRKAGATTISADAQGRLAGLNGELVLEAQQIGRLHAHFMSYNGIATDIAARLQLADGLPPAFLPARAAIVSVKLKQTADGYAIPALSLSWGGVSAHANLTLANAGRIAGMVTLASNQPLAIANSRIASLTALVTVAGSLSAPSLAGRAMLTGIRRQDAKIAALSTTFTAASRDHGFALAVSGMAHGAELPAPIGRLVGADFGFKTDVARAEDGLARIDAFVDGAGAQLHAHAALGAVSGAGTLAVSIGDLAKAGAGVAGRAQIAFDLTRLTWRGDVTGSLTASGQQIAPKGVGAALGSTPKLRAKFTIANGSYAIDDIVFDSAAATMTGAARLDRGAHLVATLKTTRGDLAALSSLVGQPLKGRFALSATVTGSAIAPVIALAVAAPQVQIGPDLVEGLRLNLVAKQAEGWAGHIALAAQTSAGPIDLAADGKASADGFSLSVTQGALGPAAVSGNLLKAGARYSGTLTLSGEVLKPAAIVLGLPMTGTGRITATGSSKGLSFAADLRHVATNGLADATVHAQAQMMAMPGTLTAQLALSDGANHLAAGGQGKWMARSFTLSSLGGSWSGAAFALRQPTTLTIKNGVTTLGRTALAVAGGDLVLCAEMAPGNLHAAVDLSALPLAPLAQMFHAPKASGTLSLTMRADFGPRRTEASVKIGARNVAFSAAGKKVKPADLDLTAHWDGAVLTAQGKLSGIDAKDATLIASLPLIRRPDGYLPMLGQSGPINAHLAAQLDASNFMALLPLAEQTMSGQIIADVTVEGDIANPQLAGSLALANASFTDLETGTHLEKIDLTLHATGGPRAALSLSATDGNGGKVKGSGAFSLDALAANGIGHLAGNLDLAFDNAELVREDLVRGAVSGTVAVALPGNGPPTISGKLRTNTVRIDIGAAIPPTIPTIKVININGGPMASPQAPLSARPTWFGAARVDIALTMPNRLFISGQGLTSEWSGQVQVNGTLAHLKYEGQLQSVTGQIELVGKSFDVQSGTVLINDTLPGGATLNIIAQNSSTNLTVTLTVTGAVAHPQIAWSSTPSLPQSEILSHLFFGTGTPQLSAGQAFELAQMSGALDSFGLGGSVVGGVTGFLRNLAGLDVLSFSGPSGSGAAGASVTAGKYINDRIYVGVTQGTDTSASSAEVRVKVAPHITVTGTAGANNANSVGVDWRWSY